ncbi:tetrapyrrole biosynthesis uroporphyrinogen III synthase [Cristinia sonorae]|uniref:Tetrapyrrole biosynthesis uroporphyrinogen III synthase n=1 Tax=Cristinia sonorae TaxID=1940300 RepID=A0A8K0XM87_9AGAR|nr:tetrapyrrole biosynthesis uroporphyrinogen III synthase [Cristinia sonorae]
MSSSTVLLLRAPSQDIDKYEAEFTSNGYHPISIPVLETVLLNLPPLLQIVQAGPVERKIHGVIVTSARACEAWRCVLEQIIAGEHSPSRDADWSTTPFYVVGEATASSLSDLPPHPRLTPRIIRGASEGGTSEKLAHFILKDLDLEGRSRDHDDVGKPTLLYLTGDKNRDTLPGILSEGGVELESLQVYGTVGSSRFGRDLEEGLRGAPLDTKKWWVVYFAPSAAAFVTPFLKNHFSLPTLDDPHQEQANTNAHLAAIGPTTANFLRDTLKLAVNVTSPKPTPEALNAAILQFDTS